MPDTALSQPAASSLPPVLKDGRAPQLLEAAAAASLVDRKSTRLNSSHT